MPELFVEVSPVDQSGAIRPSLSRLDDLHARLDEVTESVADIARRFRDGVAVQLFRGDGTNLRMDEIELAFKISLKAEAGVIVSKGSAEAAFEVTLRWRAASDDEQ